MIAVDTNMLVYAHRRDAEFREPAARVAALCVEHGVRELWSADRDFTRFPGVRVGNPVTG